MTERGRSSILQAVIPEQPAKHAQAKQCVQTNHHFLKALVSAAELDGIHEPQQGISGQSRTSPHDVEKVRCAYPSKRAGPRLLPLRSTLQTRQLPWACACPGPVLIWMQDWPSLGPAHNKAMSKWHV